MIIDKLEFIKGSVSELTFSKTLEELESNYRIGAVSSFLGRIREDIIDGKKVSAIEYSCNEELAYSVFENIIVEAKKSFNTEAIIVFHSLGNVPKGKICLMVLVACGHRKESFKAIEYVVERIKKELPVWGKEILSDNLHSWKVNK